MGGCGGWRSGVGSVLNTLGLVRKLCGLCWLASSIEPLACIAPSPQLKHKRDEQWSMMEVVAALCNRWDGGGLI